MLLRSITYKRGYALIEYDEGKKLLIDASLCCNLVVGEQFNLNQLLEDNEAFSSEFAMKEAIKYLSITMRSASQTREHLINKGLQKRSVDKTVEKLISVKYLNDEAYAEYYVSDGMLSGLGKRKIEINLRGKGIDEITLQKALATYDTKALQNNAKAFIDKKNRLLSKYPPQVRREKLIRAALQRGFDSGEVLVFIDEHLAEDKGNYEEYYEPLIKKKVESLRRKGVKESALRTKIYSEFMKLGAKRSLIDKYLD